eukprot:jgi/Botrbrau1/12665/Bobra.67_1s0029.2
MSNVQIVIAAAYLLSQTRPGLAAPVLQDVEPSVRVPGAEFNRIHGYNSSQNRRTSFVTIAGLFVQEDADRALEAPGQHDNFGALRSWDYIHSLLDHETRLLLLIRHGEAWSNRVQAEVGRQEWKEVGTQCRYYNETLRESFSIFDPELTDEGAGQAEDLRSLLTGRHGWLKTLSGGRPFTVITSPLTRCVRTALTVFDGIVPPGDLRVSEYVRERLGVETCDARRGINRRRAEGPVGLEPDLDADSRQEPNLDTNDGPEPVLDMVARRQLKDVDVVGSGKQQPLEVVQEEVGKKHHRRERVNCPYRQGLADSFPEVNFPIVEGEEGFGLLADEDVLWEADYRESKSEVADRLSEFLHVLYRTTDHKVLFVVLHSGSTRGALEAVGRQAYRPQNGELVPLLVQRVRDT